MKKLKPTVVPTSGNYTLNRGIVATDAGNGKSLSWMIHDGKFTRSIIPHARVQVTGTRLSGSDVEGQHIVDYADWQGDRYGFGDGIWDVATRYPIETHQNTEGRYGSDMHLFLIMVTLALMGYKNGEHLKLVVPAPPGLLDQVSPQIKASIIAGEDGKGTGKWTIALNGKKPISLYIDKVICVPEGQPAFFAYRFDAEGNVVELPTADGYDALSGNVQIVDLGFGTCDTFQIQNGIVAPESIIHSTDTSGGISTHITTPVLDEIRSITGSSHLTQAHVDGWLRFWAANGYREEAASVIVSGKSMNLHNIFTRRSERYAQWVIQEKLNPAWRNGADSILEVGGGWLYIEPAVRRYFPKRLIITPLMYEHTKNLSLVDLNAFGGLIIAAVSLKKQRERSL